MKEKLLGLGVFIDNEYLDLYCSLIESNRQTKKEKFKTQQHHIVQKAYYQLKGKELDNTQANLVNLLYKDHALAHYYLALCVVDDLKLPNILAFNFCLNNKNYKTLPKYSSEKQLLEELEQLQKLYEDFSQLYQDKQYITKDGITKKVIKSTVPEYLADGWVLGNGQKGKSRNTHPIKLQVICIETQKIFTSVAEASVWCKGNVNKSINSEYTSLAGGYHWAKLADTTRRAALAEYIGKSPVISPVQGKKCRCVETNTYYDSVSEAMQITGLTSIKPCCQGRSKTAGGYHWEYVN